VCIVEAEYEPPAIKYYLPSAGVLILKPHRAGTRHHLAVIFNLVYVLNDRIEAARQQDVS
jgi:hypothetical protein